MFAERTTTMTPIESVIHVMSDNNIWDPPADFVDIITTNYGSGRVTGADSSWSAVP